MNKFVNLASLVANGAMILTKKTNNFLHVTVDFVINFIDAVYMYGNKEGKETVGNFQNLVLNEQ